MSTPSSPTSHTNFDATGPASPGPGIAAVSETSYVDNLLKTFPLDPKSRDRVTTRASKLVQQLRAKKHADPIGEILTTYSLNSPQGNAMMRLAESYIRTPDSATKNALLSDTLSGKDWAPNPSSTSIFRHAKRPLNLASSLLAPDPDSKLKQIAATASLPILRTATNAAIHLMGREFVFASTIRTALKKADQQHSGLFSFDMLGEAARTRDDATKYFNTYEQAILALGKSATSDSVHRNSGISVKLSALFPRYETMQKAEVMAQLMPRLRQLLHLAATHNIGLTIDAEEMARLSLSLEIVEQVLQNPTFKNWAGFGIVVQAYSLRAGNIIDWLHDQAIANHRKISVRLVKGAYWDAEIKIAQEKGLANFPVFTQKAHTDIAYIHHAAKLLGYADTIFPQFATQNAHTMAAILELEKGEHFEFQRLHGMGKPLHDLVAKHTGRPSRTYAPVGSNKDLLAYLVRRLMENGANSSFVNKLNNPDISPANLVADPVAQAFGPSRIKRPDALFNPTRKNSTGWDLDAEGDLSTLSEMMAPFAKIQWHASPLLAQDVALKGRTNNPVENPADLHTPAGTVIEATEGDCDIALATARDFLPEWRKTSVTTRADSLEKFATALETNTGEMLALLTREAGKTLADALAELREAVDFARFYAAQSRAATQSHERPEASIARGTVIAISPWNFPLAIFTGQITAALSTGNCVIAKPAETTPLIAMRAVQLMHQAGIPRAALQLLPGTGAKIGAGLIGSGQCDMVAFTGSTKTAQHINRQLANSANPAVPFIAETGGLNAMIIDSTALLERSVDDIISSAFASAGQRCSALRILYVQNDIAPALLTMLHGAMAELALGDPAILSSDIGPVIDATARKTINSYIDQKQQSGKILYQTGQMAHGHFINPITVSVTGISEMREEIFGPVLHIARFAANQLDTVIAEINGAGYGLTFGIQSRIEQRCNEIAARIKVGNIYINRNQIGAVVGSQPFGGTGLSGTGPKAGGPLYLSRFLRQPTQIPRHFFTDTALPGPDGETNIYRVHPRGTVLCLGPTYDDIKEQVARAGNTANKALVIHPNATQFFPASTPRDGEIEARDQLLDDFFELLQDANQPLDFDVVCYAGPLANCKKLRRLLANRDGPLIPLNLGAGNEIDLVHEKLICTDITAIGGNIALLD